MQAGRLDRKITLETPDKNTTSFGEEGIEWIPVGEVWANVKPLTGGESFSSLTRFAEASIQFTVRWRSDITPEYRVSYQGQVYDLIDVREIGRREGLLLIGKGRDE